MRQAELISVGSINVDIQVRVERWPEPGETMLGKEFLLTGGGKGANVAVLARRLGAPVRLIGRVGDDALARIALASLEEAGVDLSQVKPVQGCHTAVSTIAVRPDGRKTIILAPNANESWSPDDEGQLEEVIAAAPAGSVLVTDLEVPTAIVRAAMAAAKRRSLPVVLDPSPADRLEDDLCPMIYALTPNPSEAKILTGIEVESPDDAERAGRALLDRGIEVVCQKLAGGGCVVVSADVCEHVSEVPVEVQDTTGAGDAFAGAIGVALLEGKGLVEAARFAVAASHIAVSTYGSQEAYPDRAEIDAMVTRLSEAAGASGSHPDQSQVDR